MSPTEMWLWIIGIGIVWIIGWLIWARIWPYANCRKCKGQGRFKSPTGRSWRNCPRCKGTGRRIMVGRKIWDKVLAVKKDATG